MTEHLSLSDKVRMVLTGRQPDAISLQTAVNCELAERIAGVIVPSGRSDLLGVGLWAVPTTILIGLPFGAVPVAIKLLELQTWPHEEIRSLGIVVDPVALAESGAETQVCHEVLSAQSQLVSPEAAIGLVTELAQVDSAGLEIVCSIAQRCHLDFLMSSGGVVRAPSLSHGDVREIRAMLPGHTELWVVGAVPDRASCINLLAHGADQVGMVPEVDGVRAGSWQEVLFA